MQTLQNDSWYKGSRLNANGEYEVIDGLYFQVFHVGDGIASLDAASPLEGFNLSCWFKDCEVLSNDLGEYCVYNDQIHIRSCDQIIHTGQRFTIVQPRHDFVGCSFDAIDVVEVQGFIQHADFVVRESFFRKKHTSAKLIRVPGQYLTPYVDGKQYEAPLHEYDKVIINSSGGKDSLCALYHIHQLAIDQGYDLANITVSHQDLGLSEWEGTRELAHEQAKLFGFNFVVTERRTQSGDSDDILQYTLRRGKWPSSKQRWCTSDFKRGPGARVVTAQTKGMKGVKVLYVFGFRKQESPSRSKRQQICVNWNLTNQSRVVHDYLPIHHYTTEKVWDIIHTNSLPYHYCYDLGMPRHSCVFCIFSPKDALVIAGKNNPELLDKYIEVEVATGHSFKQQHSLQDIKKLIMDGYDPDKIEDWTM